MARTTELRFALIGLGGIGRAVLGMAKHADPGLVACVGALTRPDRVALDQRRVGGSPPIVGNLPDLLALGPDIVLECAGQEALRSYGPAILENGVDLIAISSGAFSEARFEVEMRNLAKHHGRQVIVPAGAILGIDGLAAAKHAGLRKVLYTGRKPPQAWRGTPAEARLDLSKLTSPETFFEGNARDAARDYPRNANVTATVALAGTGFEKTRVRLIADPATTMNIHELEYEGDFGEARVVVAGHPSPTNLRTSLLASLSIWESLSGRAHGIALG